jgi:hypothetical protein
MLCGREEGTVHNRLLLDTMSTLTGLERSVCGVTGKEEPSVQLSLPSDIAKPFALSTPPD